MKNILGILAIAGMAIVIYSQYKKVKAEKVKVKI